MAAFVNSRTKEVVSQRQFYLAKINHLEYIPGRFYVGNDNRVDPGDAIMINSFLRVYTPSICKGVPSKISQTTEVKKAKKLFNKRSEEVVLRSKTKYIAVGNPCTCSQEMKDVEQELREALAYPPDHDTCAICGGKKQALIKVA